MLLRINKAGNGYVSGYTLSVSTSEARALGFVDENGERVELEKILDEEKHQLIIRIKPSESDNA